jgi:glycosyltransferase involved in cell wall biosynthesis
LKRSIFDIAILQCQNLYKIALNGILMGTAYLAVVTPVYATKQNRRFDYFQNTAGSVLAQTADFQWIVVDDGSPDQRPREFLQDLHDPRIKLLTRRRQPGDLRTASNALNLGFNHAVKETLCDCFCYVHSDDLLPKDSLSRRMAALDSCGMLYGKICVFSSEYTISKSSFENPLDTKNMKSGFPHHTSTWSRQFLEEMLAKRGGVLFDPNFSYGEDLDVTCCARRVLESTDLRLGFLDKVVYIWVGNPKNISAETPNKERRRQRKAILAKNGYSEEPFSWSDFVNDFIRRPGHFLPESIKRRVRPHTGTISRLSRGFFFPNAYQTCEIEINPFWFLENQPQNRKVYI